MSKYEKKHDTKNITKEKALKNLKNIFHIFIISIIMLLLPGCKERGLIKLFKKRDHDFPAHSKKESLALYGRICSYNELHKYFSNPEQLYHFHHVLHIRMVNSGYQHYLLSGDQLSFFAIPESSLKNYTHSRSLSHGYMISLFSAILSAPFYIAAYINNHSERFINQTLGGSITITQSMATLAGSFIALWVTPLIAGYTLTHMYSSTYYKEATSLTLTQDKEISLLPYKTKDILIIAPRAGFTYPAEFNFYNNATHEYEKLSLDIKPRK